MSVFRSAVAILDVESGVLHAVMVCVSRAVNFLTEVFDRQLSKLFCLDGVHGRIGGELYPGVAQRDVRSIREVFVEAHIVGRRIAAFACPEGAI